MNSHDLHHEFEQEGFHFKVYLPYDDSGGAPWEDDCIYDGVVSDWKRDTHYGRYPRKASHERILCRDSYSYRTFDVRQFIKVAVSHGCTPQQAHEQAESCFQRLRRWCDDQWHYIGVVVECYSIDEDGDPDELLGEDSIWGVGDDDMKYVEELINEMTSGLLYQQRTERIEAHDAASRDIVTL